MSRGPHLCPVTSVPSVNPVLFRVASLLLARPFASECLLGAALIAGLQIEGVFLDVLDDVLLLHFALKAAEGTFDGLAFLNFYFCQCKHLLPSGICRLGRTFRSANNIVE